MATIVDALVITLGLDPKGVQDGMQKAEGTISGGIKKIVSILGPIATGAAFKGAMDTFVQTADNLGKTADRIGVSVKDLDTWGMAAEDAGGSAEAFQSSLEGLNQGIQQLATQGSGRMKAPLEALGISAVDAAGKAKEPLELMKELAGVAGTMDKAKFAGLAAKLGLDKGTIALLQQGDVEVEKLLKDMEKYAYTQEDAQVAADFSHEMQFLGRAFQKVAATVMRTVVPAFTWLADKFRNLVMMFADSKATVVAVFAGIAAVVLSKVVPALKTMDNVWMKSKSLMTISAIAAAIGALYLILDDFITYCEGGESALEDLWSVFGTPDEIMASLSGLKDTVLDIVDTLSQGVQKMISYFSDCGKPLLDVFINLFTLLKGLFTGDTEAIKTGFLGLLGSLKDLAAAALSGLANLVTDLLSNVFKGLAGLAGPILDEISGAIGSVYDTITTKLGEAWEWVKSKAFGIFEGIKNFVGNIFSGLGDLILGPIKSVVSKIPDFMLPDSVKAWANSADATVKSAAPAVAAAGTATGEVSAGMAANGGVGEVSAAGAVENTTNIDNSQETTNNNVSVTVNATTPDPGAVGQAAAKGTQTGMGNVANGSRKI